MLPAMRPRSRVAVLAPTYEEHAVAWRRLGHAVDEVGSLDKCGDSDVAVVVNPNNPDGRTTGRGTLTGIAEASGAARRLAGGGRNLCRCRAGREPGIGPWLGDGSIEATAADIRRGLRVYVGACLLLAVLVAGLWAASRLLAGMPLR